MSHFAIPIEATEFKGQPVSFENPDDGGTMKVISTIRGHEIRQGTERHHIGLGDWIIFQPFFKIVSAKHWRAIEKVQTDGDT